MEDYMSNQLKDFRITADQAREYANLMLEEPLIEAYQAIQKAVSKGQKSVILRSDFWGSGGYNKTGPWLEACRILREEDGFEVNAHYEERQFVDIGTKISW
jgi:hypothetical protein